MIRSSSYSRYFSTATARLAGIAPKARMMSAVTTALLPYPGPWPIATGITNTPKTNATRVTTAPLYSHLSCCRRSPSAWRYVGIWMTIQASQAASDSTMAAA